MHARNMPLADDVDLDTVARPTVGFSGADLKNLVNEAALLAARNGRKKQVEAEISTQSRDKIIMGAATGGSGSARRRRRSSPTTKQAMPWWPGCCPAPIPLKKVTIIPRGRSLGATEQLPGEDRHNLSRKYLLNRICVMLGGRAAEKLVSTISPPGPAMT